MNKRQLLLEELDREMLRLEWDIPRLDKYLSAAYGKPARIFLDLDELQGVISFLKSQSARKFQLMVTVPKAKGVFQVESESIPKTGDLLFWESTRSTVVVQECEIDPEEETLVLVIASPN